MKQDTNADIVVDFVRDLTIVDMMYIFAGMCLGTLLSAIVVGL